MGAAREGVMIYGMLPGTERGDLLIISRSVITIRDWAEKNHPDLDGLRIFRPHEVTNLVEEAALEALKWR